MGSEREMGRDDRELDRESRYLSGTTFSVPKPLGEGRLSRGGRGRGKVLLLRAPNRRVARLACDMKD